MKVAAQLYTVRDYCKDTLGIEQTFERVKDIGYQSVQLSGVDFSKPRELARLVKKYGLDVCVTHTPFNRMVEDLDGLIEEHKLYGCNIIGLGALPSEYATSKEGYLSFADIINDIDKKLKPHGMEFSYHNHAFEFLNFDGKNGLDILFENTNCLFTLDLYWLQAAGVSPLNYIERYKGRVKVVHFKDMGVKGNDHIMAAVGAGNMDYKALTKASVNAGIAYAAVEQDDCYGEDPFNCLKTSYDNIMGYLL